MHLTMRAMNEFHRAAVAGTTTNALSMRARSACSNHMRCRVVKTLHQIPTPTLHYKGFRKPQFVAVRVVLAPNPPRSHHDQPDGRSIVRSPTLDEGRS